MAQHVSWRCGFCKGVLPVLEGEEQWLRASVNTHLSTCSKAPKGATNYDNQVALNKQCGLEKPRLKAHSLAWARNMQQKGLAGIATVQEKSVHNLARIDNDRDNRAMFACTQCTRHWRGLNDLRTSHSAPQKCEGSANVCSRKNALFGIL